MRSGRLWCSGKPTVRKAQFLSGRRRIREANAGGRKATGNRDTEDRPLRRSSRITGRIRALMPWPERALTRIW
jgi:hypothetical protein